MSPFRRKSLLILNCYPVLRIRIKLMRILICFFTLMRIRSRGLTWMEIRIRLIYVWCGSGFRNPDPASHQSAANRNNGNSEYRFSTAPYCTSITSNVSVYGLPWLHFEPLQLLNFDFYSATDPFYIWCAPGSGTGFTLMWIRIRAVLDPQHCWCKF